MARSQEIKAISGRIPPWLLKRRAEEKDILSNGRARSRVRAGSEQESALDLER